MENQMADEEELWVLKEKQLAHQEIAQAEAHIHFTVAEAGHIIEEEGPTFFLSLLSDDAREELQLSIINAYHKRLVEATSGL
tara:strand:- start:454 stop:699 length:246 start_codon:yes stop_codon:yes gene_type:complete